MCCCSTRNACKIQTEKVVRLVWQVLYCCLSHNVKELVGTGLFPEHASSACPRPSFLSLAPGELLERHRQRLEACTAAAPRPDPCTVALRAWLEAPAPPPHRPAACGSLDRGGEGADEEPPANLLVSGSPCHPNLFRREDDADQGLPQ